jgi:arylsulfatase A-like enzyme
MRYPRLIGARAADDRLAAHWDLMPTLATLTSAWRLPVRVDGIPLVTQTPTASPVRHEMLYWETHEPSFMQVVRDNNWWAFRAGAGPWQLFDLTNDPTLQQNVASSQGQVLTRIDKFARLSHVASPTWKQGPPAARSGG